MATDREIFAEAARLGAAGVAFVLVTVVATKGSTPRDAGAKMIWVPRGDGGTGEFVGTVGGGQFEMLVAESAARVLGSRGTAMEHYVLGAEAEQCCGGVMDVFLEYCGARQRVVIFGAGHVAHELTDVLRGSGLEIVVVDDRAEWNSAARFEGRARRVMAWEEGVRLARERAGETLALVMTCSHETDFELLRALLGDGGRTGEGGTGCPLKAAGEPVAPAFVGLIGSRSKRVCLFGRLIASGIEEDVVKRVQCPIGVGNTGKEPRMVAVSMAAGVLLEARRMEEAKGAGERKSAAIPRTQGAAGVAPATWAGRPMPLSGRA